VAPMILASSVFFQANAFLVDIWGDALEVESQVAGQRELRLN